jgi:hypothetical protein
MESTALEPRSKWVKRLSLSYSVFLPFSYFLTLFILEERAQMQSFAPSKKEGYRRKSLLKRTLPRAFCRTKFNIKLVEDFSMQKRVNVACMNSLSSHQSDN